MLLAAAPTRFILTLICAQALLATLTQASDNEAGLQFFETKIRPLLAAQCYDCHSVNAKKLKGKLYADSLQGLLKGGELGSALTPGKPESSRMLEAVSYKNQDLQMPPDSKLTDAQIADLTDWVKQGAPWPNEPPPKIPDASEVPNTPAPFDLQKRKATHWAWQPLNTQPPPAVKNATWAANPLDAYILNKLEAKNLAPAPLADKGTLLRRASFDLIGLPPTPEELDAFLKDDSPQAYEKVLDRLLASPHFGERWARHWLDLVRFAESHGHEFDFPIPNAYQYRDYVIRALNADVPYDQFVTEHLAGDLLERPRLNPQTGINESRLATGFFLLGEDVQAPVDVRQHQADRFDNMLDITGKTFLAMTVACARCHDHKFDAISTADYYALYGYLKSSRYTQAPLDERSAKTAAEKLSALKKQIVSQAREALQKKTAGLPATLAKFNLKTKLDPNHPLYAWARMAKVPPTEFAAKWNELAAELKKRTTDLEASVQKRNDHELKLKFFLEEQAFSPQAGAIVGADLKRPLAEIREGGWLASDGLSKKLEGSARSADFKIQQPFLRVLAKGKGARLSVIIDNFTLIRSPIYGGLRKVVNAPNETWQSFDLSMWLGHSAYIELTDTVTPFPGDEAHVGAADNWIALHQIVTSDQNAGDASGPNALDMLNLIAPPESLEALADRYRAATLAALDRSGPDLAQATRADAALLNALLEAGMLDLAPNATPELEALLKKYHEIEAALTAPARAPALADGPGQDENVFIRGSHKTPGPLVPRRFLTALAGEAQPAPASGSGRLELAQRVTDPSNPLFSRVIVNRLWHHLFGRGLAAATDNFGKLGEEPTHPELLDFLAARFLKDGCSIKTALRKIMLSSTYRMSSNPVATNDAKLDPDNKLLSHQRLKRLEGEALRDAMLSLSGRLDENMYGPSIDVYLTPYMTGRGRPGKSGPLDGAGRRSIYTAVRRNFIPPMMLAFDTPVPFSSMGRRTVSNVPAQALILLNDPFVLQQAELWAKRTLAIKDATPEQRVETMYKQAFARMPSAAEVKEGLEYIEEQSKEPKETEQSAWSDYAHVLINVKEFIFVK